MIWPAGRLLICAPTGRERLMIPEWIVERGGVPLFARGCPEILRILTASGVAQTLVVLVASPECRSQDVVERCLTLRAVAPTAPLILVSPFVTHNDFSAERHAMCDVVLAMPCTQWAFATAVKTAIDNSRCREAALTAPVHHRPPESFSVPAGQPAAPPPAEAGRALRSVPAWTVGLAIYAGLAATWQTFL